MWANYLNFENITQPKQLSPRQEVYEVDSLRNYVPKAVLKQPSLDLYVSFAKTGFHWGHYNSYMWS